MANVKDSLFEQIKRTRAYNETRIDDNSHRYDESWLYYMSQRPINIEPPTPEQEAKGETPCLEYVEPIVYNAVEGLTPQILNIFTENDEQAVAFRDLSFKPNPIMQEIINKQINRVILQENDGYRLLENALKEALVSGDCFTKIYYDEEYKDDKIVLNDWSPIEEVIGSLSEKQWECDLPEGLANGTQKKGSEGGIEWRTVNTEQTDPISGQPLQQTQLNIEIKGTLPIYQRTKELRIENVGLRDLIIDTSCGEDFSKCRYICHKMNMTVGEAVKMGYSEKALRDASTNSRLADAPYNKFNLVTNSQIGMSEEDYDDNGDPLERMITIYEEYLYSSIPSNGKESKFYQTHSTDCKLLDYKEITVMPFVHGQVMTIPESFWGRSMYDIFHFYQDNESKMQRLAYKNAFNATYNKIIVTKGQYDVESVLNSNSPGAIIEQKSPGAVQPWPYVDLPNSFGVAADRLMNSRKETMGRMVGGINTQEGAPEELAVGTARMILAQEQMKHKVHAKTFARTYVKPLSEKLYEVMKENGVNITIPGGTKLLSVAEPLPQDITVNSNDWPNVWDFNVDINTDGDVALQNQQLAATLNMFSQVQQNKLATPSAIYKVGERFLKSVNLDIAQFFTDPSSQQPSQEELEAQQFQKEGAVLQMEKLKAETSEIVAKTAAHIVDAQTKTDSSNVEAAIKFAESQSKIQKEAADARNNERKTDLDAAAILMENENQKADITVKHASNVMRSRTINGIPNP